MNPDRSRASLIAFYFGRSAARDPHSDAAIRAASWKAYRDVARTITGMGSHQSASDLKTETIDSLVEFVHSLDAVATQADFDSAHQHWCENLIRIFAGAPHLNRSDFKLHYGQAQKWLNMTLKYLAVLNHPSVEPIYEYLHAPVDGDVYRQAAVTLQVARPSAAWSRLEGDTYRSYQLQLRHRALGNGSACVMDWETDEWIKAR